MTTTVLMVRLDERPFAFRIADVHEVVRSVAVTPLPGGPAVVEGVIDYRGTVIPVLNLRRRFGLAPRPIALSDRFTIVRASGRRVALRVDSVDAVAELDEGDVLAAEGLWAAGVRISGVMRVGNGLVLFEELASFLSQTETEALNGALASEARNP